MFNKKEKELDIEFFTVYDSKTGVYDEPLYAKNSEDLVRHITNMFKHPNRDQNKYYLNAEDYSLFHCGGFSKKSGLLSSPQLTHVVNLHDLRTVANATKSTGLASEVQTQ